MIQPRFNRWPWVMAVVTCARRLMRRKHGGGLGRLGGRFWSGLAAPRRTWRPHSSKRTLGPLERRSDVTEAENAKSLALLPWRWTRARTNLRLRSDKEERAGRSRSASLDNRSLIPNPSKGLILLKLVSVFVSSRSRPFGDCVSSPSRSLPFFLHFLLIL